MHLFLPQKIVMEEQYSSVSSAKKIVGVQSPSATATKAKGYFNQVKYSHYLCYLRFLRSQRIVWDLLVLRKLCDAYLAC